MSRYILSINRETHTIEAESDMPVLWILRDLLGLMGTKYGCGIGRCGSCTIHLDGRAVRSCQLTVGNVGTQKITTIEGLEGEHVDSLYDAWLEERVSQCGYCQPGQIMSAAMLLNKTSQPTDEEIIEAMAGNLCRCGTYQRIQRAIRRAARTLSSVQQTGVVEERGG